MVSLTFIFYIFPKKYSFTKRDKRRKTRLFYGIKYTEAVDFCQHFRVRKAIHLRMMDNFTPEKTCPLSKGAGGAARPRQVGVTKPYPNGVGKGTHSSPL